MAKGNVTRRARVMQIVEALECQGQEDWSRALLQCGGVVKVMECGVCGKFRHPVVYHCKLKICYECAKRKARELRRKYLPILQQLHDLKFLTLTIRNSPDLVGSIEKIRKAFRRLRQRKEIKARLIGGLYAIEVTIGRDGLWHVHLHAVVSMRYIPQERLSQIWEEITGDPIVDVRKVNSPKKALRYITEYLSKGVSHMLDKWPLPRLVEFLVATVKYRFIQAIGGLYGVVGPRPPLKCPHCGESIFVIYDAHGHVLFNMVGYILRTAYDTY